MRRISRTRLCTLVFALSAAVSSAALAQTETIAPSDGQHLREIRCNANVTTPIPQLVQLSREQCLLIGKEVGTLPEHSPEQPPQSAFDVMATDVKPGSQAPESAKLQALPPSVTGRFPELGRYQYFVTTNNIALVAPGDKTIVALVEVHVRPRKLQ